MIRRIKLAFVFIFVVALSACVTVEPPKPIIVNGAVGYKEKIMLPPGAVINIAIIDMNTPGAIIAQKTFEVARVPVAFKFILPPETIDKKMNYGVVAMITYRNHVIFQTYNRYPVINNGLFTTEVIMQPVEPQN